MNHVAKLLVIVLISLCGGGLGYLSQSGFLDLLAIATPEGSNRESATEHALQPIREAEYQRKILRGWWWGCAGGAVMGLVMVVQFSREPTNCGKKKSS